MRETWATDRDRTAAGGRTAEIALLTVLALLAALLLARPLLQMGLHIPLNYNEGFNAYVVDALRAGRPIYPPLDGFATNNYPPLSFHVTALVTPLFGGDAVVAGRALAALSLLLTAGFLAVAGAALTDRRTAGVAAGLLFLVINGIWFGDYVAMNDPQWMGHALQAAAVALLARGIRDEIGTGRVVAVTLLLFLGGLVKHNLIVLPAAVALWFLVHDRRALGTFVATGVLATAAAAGLGAFLHGPLLFEGILFHARAFSAGQLMKMLAQLASAFAPFAVPALLLALLDRRDPGVRLVLAAYGIGLLVGLPALGGIGVNYNALFDVVMATPLVLVLLADRLAARLAGPGLARPAAFALATALAASPALAGVSGARAAYNHWRDEAARADDYAAVIAALAAADGPVACHTLSLCYWAGRPFEIDMYNYGQKLWTGAVPTEPLVALLRARHYRMIQIHKEFFEAHVMPPDVEAALTESYRLERETPVMLYVPRD